MENRACWGTLAAPLARDDVAERRMRVAGSKAHASDSAVTAVRSKRYDEHDQ